MNEARIVIELNDQEAEALFSVADAACRGAGLAMAAPCAALQHKLVAAVMERDARRQRPTVASDAPSVGSV